MFMHHSTQMTDQVLMAALKNGDARAFDHLYHKYYPKLFNFLRKLCQSPESAEDLAHDVFIKVWINRSGLDSRLCFSSYLFTIAKHQLLNYIRKQKTCQAFIKTEKWDLPTADNQTEHDVIFADYVAFYQKALDKLPPHKKHIFLLSHKEGKTHQEIADGLHLSKKTIEFHLRDCLTSLRRQFSQHTDVRL